MSGEPDRRSSRLCLRYPLHKQYASSFPSLSFLVEHQGPRGSYWCATPVAMETRNRIKHGRCQSTTLIIASGSPLINTLLHPAFPATATSRFAAHSQSSFLAFCDSIACISLQPASQPFNQITNNLSHDPVNPHLLYRGSFFRACPAASRGRICLCSLS